MQVTELDVMHVKCSIIKHLNKVLTRAAFNEWRLDKIHPSSSLVVDESFGWVSQKPDDMPDALPHTCTQKIIHKPKGVGTQFKDLADGVTGDPGKEG